MSIAPKPHRSTHLRNCKWLGPLSFAKALRLLIPANDCSAIAHEAHQIRSGSVARPSPAASVDLGILIGKLYAWPKLASLLDFVVPIKCWISVQRFTGLRLALERRSFASTALDTRSQPLMLPKCFDKKATAPEVFNSQIGADSPSNQLAQCQKNFVSCLELQVDKKWVNQLGKSTCHLEKRL